VNHADPAVREIAVREILNYMYELPPEGEFAVMASIVQEDMTPPKVAEAELDALYSKNEARLRDAARSLLAEHTMRGRVTLCDGAEAIASDTSLHWLRKWAGR
jgi:hypothetical protein